MPKKKEEVKTLKDKITGIFKAKPCECPPELQHYEKCHICHRKEKHHRFFALILIALGGIILFTWLNPYTRDKIQTLTQTDRCDLRYLIKKADRGNVLAQMELVNRYSTECYSLAFSSKHKNYWLHKSAQEENHAPAQYQLSILYSIGETLPRNYKESMKWLKMSAEQEYMPAEYELAKRYKKGTFSTKANPQEFLFWLMRAAHSGSDRASEELGYLYEKGIFVPENKIEAYKWYSLSTNKDSHKLDILELGMTKKQIEQAQREASVLYKIVFKKINK